MMFCAALFESSFIPRPSLGRQAGAGGGEVKGERKGGREGGKNSRGDSAQRCYNDSPVPFALDASPSDILSLFLRRETVLFLLGARAAPHLTIAIILSRRKIYAGGKKSRHKTEERLYSKPRDAPGVISAILMARD